MSLVEQELYGVRVTRSLVFRVNFCRSMFDLFSFVHCVVCPPITTAEHPFCIFKVLLHTPPSSYIYIYIYILGTVYMNFSSYICVSINSNLTHCFKLCIFNMIQSHGIIFAIVLNKWKSYERIPVCIKYFYINV